MLIIRDVNKPISDMGKKLLINFDKISLSYTLAKLAIFRQKIDTTGQWCQFLLGVILLFGAEEFSFNST